MNLSLVSIIIPTYNYALFLEESLTKLQKQTYPHWECIIVDDGSTDNTREVVGKFVEQDKRFIYFYQPNQGVSVARNFGLSQAKGKYIQFLDADDYIADDKLEIGINILEQNPTIDLVYSDEYTFAESNDTNFKFRPIEVPTNFEQRLARVLAFTPFGIDNPLFRKEIIDKVGYFNTELDSGEDWLFWFKVIYAKFEFHKYTEKPLVFIRTHSTSKKKRKYVSSQLKLRKIIETYPLTKMQRYISRRHMYWHIILYAKLLKEYHYVIYYCIEYWFYAFPKTRSDFNMMIGDIMFPWLRKLIKGK
ncbi:MAG: glycosyltransferase [Microscillaceae bacterium]|nr:glycosyltransferase [Microscillaceae bacterium]MDW8460643.1 glycosyltransferase family 2 protein [Cytophagales bacterium]